MEILYRSLHNLDLSMEDPVRKEIPSDFDSYITEYINLQQTKTRHLRCILFQTIIRQLCIASLIWLLMLFNREI